MFRDDFIESENWQKILVTLREWQEVAIARLRGAEDFATCKYYTGELDAVEAMMELPEKLFSNRESPTKEAPEGVIELPNHPRSSTNLF